ncbi:hypothetical protein HUW51_04975 [Adhaeribacter swui]|uniref:Uncharacterized protein n=1 Tax=Adhaeribacter swui TaxID=2086471 RepID=A0A7G7G4M8_9BACT|nr:hypothetical protein [Adhaeribacter swui]QNF32112.1 hypothetical protein HUW51_04975 [Adhaeribacter swui]
MFANTFQQTKELAKSALQSPVYVSGDQLQNLFPADPATDVSRLLAFGLIGHRPLERTTEDKLSYFCNQNGITFRAYHENKHFVIFKPQPVNA